MADTSENWPEVETCSFIIKIWVEQARSEADPVIWRGHITHVPSGERFYLRDLDDILVIVSRYLEALGGKPERGKQVRRWLKRLRLGLKL